MFSSFFSAITFAGDSTVYFYRNFAKGNGGVMYIEESTIIFEGSSAVTFSDNHAHGNGGVLYIDQSTITFKENSTVNFLANVNSEVMYIDDSSTITFAGNSTVNFLYNIADSNGGVMYLHSSTITFDRNSTVCFTNNSAKANGGVMYIDQSTITFKGNSSVNFLHNVAYNYGGVLYIKDNSNIIFQGNSNATFHHNRAYRNGGVIHIDQNSKLKFKERARVAMIGNTAYLGGSIYLKSSSFIIYGNSCATFINNTALQDGGAIYSGDQLYFKQLEYSSVTFYHNSANDYGGAIFVLYTKRTSINFYNLAYFKGNIAGAAQSSVYINVDKSCDRDCFSNSITYKNDIPITTSPNRLVLYNPTKCNCGNETDCDTYYMNNIMLGQDITFDACLLDYNDQPTDTAQFSITGMNHQDYNISSSKYITISCNRTTKGIAVIGNLQSNNKYNYSINISLYLTHTSESKVVSVNLIVELS